MDRKTLREAQAHIAEARSFVEAVRNEMQDEYDEKSDKWKETEKGQLFEGRINTLDEVVTSLENCDSDIEDAMKD